MRWLLRLSLPEAAARSAPHPFSPLLLYISFASFGRCFQT